MTQRVLMTVAGFLALLSSTGSATGQTLPTVAEGYTVRLFANNLPGPTGIAFDPAGNLIVCTWDGGVIYSLDPQGARTVLNPENNLPRVWQPTVTPDGRIFVTAGGSSTAGRIFELVSGNPVLFYEGQGALGISWHNDELYFTQSPTGSVLRTALNGVPSTYASGLEVGIAGLLFGPDDHLYVANDDNGTIFRIDSTGAAEPYLTGLPRPEMIEFDAAGNLYFTAFTFSKIYKVDPNKQSTLLLTGSPSSNFRGIRFDGSGTLFVCDSDGGAIYKIFKSYPDADQDDVSDDSDNCPTTPNRDQLDLDADGAGDACDNCPTASNPSQQDLNEDGIGDACQQIKFTYDFEGVPRILEGSTNQTREFEAFVTLSTNVPLPKILAQESDESGRGIPVSQPAEPSARRELSCRESTRRTSSPERSEGVAAAELRARGSRGTVRHLRGARRRGSSEDSRVPITGTTRPPRSGPRPMGKKGPPRIAPRLGT